MLDSRAPSLYIRPPMTETIHYTKDSLYLGQAEMVYLAGVCLDGSTRTKALLHEIGDEIFASARFQDSNHKAMIVGDALHRLVKETLPGMVHLTDRAQYSEQMLVTREGMAIAANLDIKPTQYKSKNYPLSDKIVSVLENIYGNEPILSQEHNIPDLYEDTPPPVVYERNKIGNDFFADLEEHLRMKLHPTPKPPQETSEKKTALHYFQNIISMFSFLKHKQNKPDGLKP